MNNRLVSHKVFGRCFILVYEFDEISSGHY
jgi:hypothetical protein